MNINFRFAARPVPGTLYGSIESPPAKATVNGNSGNREADRKRMQTQLVENTPVPSIVANGYCLSDMRVWILG